MIGENIGHYRINGKLGEGGMGEVYRGGMGEVYRATDFKLGREVAIKVLLAVFSSEVGRGHIEARKA